MSFTRSRLLAEKMPVGPSPDRWIESAREMVEAGVTHLYFHHVGPDQDGFFDFYRRELQPELEKIGTREPGAAPP